MVRRCLAMHKIKGELAEGRMASNLADGRMESKEHKLGQRLNAVSAAGNPGSLPSMIKVSLLPALFRMLYSRIRSGVSCIIFLAAFHSLLEGAMAHVTRSFFFSSKLTTTTANTCRRRH